MAANPSKRIIIEVLTEMAQEVFDRLATGEEDAVIATELGVYPAQLKKFYSLSAEHREPYRAALESAQQMQAQARAKKKVSGLRAVRTQREMVEMFAAEILDLLRDGSLVREVARGYEVDSAVIVRYFRGDDARKVEYEEALEEGGHALAEKSVEVTMGVALDMTDAKVMDTRSNRLAWLAAKRNVAYDNRQQIKHSGTLVSSVSIDIGTGD